MVVLKEKSGLGFECSIADRDRIIAENMGMISWKCKRSFGSYKNSSVVNHEDSVNTAIVEMCGTYPAFCKAREKLSNDPDHSRRIEKNWAFFCSTKALRKVKRHCGAFVVPPEYIECEARLISAIESLNESGKEVTEEAISELIGKSINSVKRIVDARASRNSSFKIEDYDVPYNVKSNDEINLIDSMDLYSYCVHVARSVLDRSEFRCWLSLYSGSESAKKKPIGVKAEHGMAIQRKAEMAMRKVKAELERRGEIG